MAQALLVLEDGSTFRGRGFGAEGEAFGEAVFNTAMSGYQEVLTDPSYAGQVVTMTYPHQGNYGTNRDDVESGRVQVAGFAVREVARRHSSWRAERSLAEDLTEAGVVGIEGIDTRRLTLRIREAGAMRCAISTVDQDAESLLARVRESPGMDGADLARWVSTREPYEAHEVIGPASTEPGRAFRVAAYDFGIKRNILRRLAEAGCEATVFPAETPASEVLDGDFDGVFLSNGPGDPAATTYGIQASRDLLGKIPVFGICLGHQLMALALGARSYKLKFGHRGANQPVVNQDTGRVEITSHNHGFAVTFGVAGSGVPSAGAAAEATTGAPPLPEREWTASAEASAHTAFLHGSPRPSHAAAHPNVAETSSGPVALTHWNLNDGTLEGLRCLDVPAFSVQYHPEAAPGPHDARYLFDRFRELIAAHA
jgi:carbamoyl-phosphate synthase small subunit